MLSALLATIFIMLSPPVVTIPEWRRQPTPDEVRSRYPSKAEKDWVEGKVVLRCVVLSTGRLDRCVVRSESPADYGFGEAALGVTRLMEMRPRTVDGAAEESEVDIPIDFRLPITNAPLPDMAGTLRCYGMIAAHSRSLPKDKVLKRTLAEALRRVRGLSAFTPWTEADLQAQLAAAEADGAKAWREGFNDDRCRLVFTP